MSVTRTRHQPPPRCADGGQRTSAAALSSSLSSLTSDCRRWNLCSGVSWSDLRSSLEASNSFCFDARRTVEEKSSSPPPGGENAHQTLPQEASDGHKLVHRVRCAVGWCMHLAKSRTPCRRSERKPCWASRQSCRCSRCLVPRGEGRVRVHRGEAAVRAC